jgi:hypothetical protein
VVRWDGGFEEYALIRSLRFSKKRRQVSSGIIAKPRFQTQEF